MFYQNYCKKKTGSKLCSLLIFVFISTLPITSTTTSTYNELKLVHVIFAHKLYAPLRPDTKYGFPEKLDYKYFLENAQEMPNEWKMEMYNLGVYLRHRYNNFLEDIYYPEVTRMLTSENFLSMISGELVNAGLWPPAESQKWKDDLDWQPIPTEYKPRESDRLFLGTLCPHFLDEEKRLMNDSSIKDEVSVHQQLFDHLSKNYGEKIERPSNISMLYSSLESIASNPELNKTLPGWAEGIFPHGEMRNVTLLSYDLLSRSPIQRQLNGGVFLKKILDDSMKIAAINDTEKMHSNVSRDVRISLYSGEERNVIGVLQAMNLWWSPHLLENGASIILELRQNKSSNEFGLEIFYYTGSADNETIGLTLPGCKEFCSLKQFVGIVAKTLPKDENVLCNEKISIVDNKPSSANFHNPKIHLLFFTPIFMLSTLH